MKYLSLFIALLFVYAAPAKADAVYNKLCEVNKCWTERQNAEQALLPAYKLLDETGWIQLHLSLVEQTLRDRPTDGLTAQQRQNRQAALAHLHQYMLAGRYPQNEDYTYRTPIFIDKHDNFCAVGYLVKATGYEQLSRMIAAKTNLAYVRDMNYPELNQWAQQYGFTTDELAWIQPGYMPRNANTTKPIGKGTNGKVFELFEDPATERLYVGGSFANADSTMTANNIAYVTEANGIYTWHTMGNGLNGTVYAITKYGANIFAAGSFTASGSTTVNNVAYWDGTSWQPAGCISGTVKDLTIFGGELYAAGSFNVCNNSSGSSFAKWDGSNWQPVAGITGAVNTLEVHDTTLLLGGIFSFGTGGKNVAKWNPLIGLRQFDNNIENEVNDFEYYNDTLYAACRRTATNDSALFQKIENNSWIPSFIGQDYSFYLPDASLNTLCSVEDTFMVGGNFFARNTYAGFGRNCFPLSPRIYDIYHTDWFDVDSIIYKMVKYKNKVIAGGNFTIGLGKGICERISNIPYHSVLIDSIYVTVSCDSGANAMIFVTPTTYTSQVSIISMQTGDTITSAHLRNAQPGDYKILIVGNGKWKDSSMTTIHNMNLDTSVQLKNNMLISMARGVSYQWLACDFNDAPIPGATDSVFQPFVAGSYAVRIGPPGFFCSAKSNCYQYIPVAVNDVAASAVKIYPNPATDQVAISLNEVKASIAIEVTNLTGRSVLSKTAENTRVLMLDIQSIPGGVYTIKLSVDRQQPVHYKLIKQ